jgi:WD40 repeat protein
VSCSIHLKYSRPVYNRIPFVAFSPDGKSLAILHYRARHAGIPNKMFVEDVSNTVALVDGLDLANVTVVHHEFNKSVQGPMQYRPRFMAFANVGSILNVLGDKAQTLRSWDPAVGDWTTVGGSSESSIFDCHVSADGEILGISRAKLTKDSNTRSQLPLMLRFDRRYLSVPCQDSKNFYLPTRNGVQVWDIASQQIIRRLHENRDRLDSVTCLAISPDGDTLAVRCQEGLRSYSVRTGEEHVLLPEFVEFKHLPNGGWGMTTHGGERTIGIAFSPDGKILAAWGDHGLKFFDMTQGGKLQRSVPDRSILCLAFAPDGKTYATGDNTGKLTIFDVATGNELRSTTIQP